MKDSLEKLIDKYLKGTATVEEQKVVEEYYASFSEDSEYTTSLSDKESRLLEDRMLNSIYKRIGENKNNMERNNILSFNSSFILRIAASLIGVLILSFAYKLFVYPAKNILQTSYGEVRTYMLPDSSMVTLNGNSSIEYASWESSGPRLVTLRGEAFFKVKHKVNNQKFIVTVPGKLNIEVLGTEFNVSERDRNSRVVLNSGKVKLNLDSEKKESIIMKPGEMIEVNSEEKNINKSVVDTEVYSSWKDNKLIFDNTSLKEIVFMLKETYGYDVQVKNKELLKQTFSGTIPGNNIEMLLLGLSKSIDIKVVKEGKLIKISK